MKYRSWRPRKNFRVGKMRERVNIQSPTLDTDGSSGRTWNAVFSDEPASFEPATAGETVRGRQVEAGIKAIFCVRYRDGYSPTYRLVHGSDTYGIASIVPVDGGRRFLELHCRGVDS